MINKHQLKTSANGPIVLTFSNWTVSRFCKLAGCASNQRSIFLKLFSEDTLDVTLSLLQSGAEATYKQKGMPFPFTDFEISEWANDLQTEDEANKLIYAFIGSMWNISTEDVPAKLDEVAGKINESDPNAIPPLK